MEIKNTFLGAKLNKDTDERMLPEGEYPNAENIRVSSTANSDIGTVQNVKGNKALTNIGSSDTITIGVYGDSSNQKIYWFNTSPTKDSVIEYDVKNKVTSVVLESVSGGVLNFSKDYLITGVVKVINGNTDDDLLVWTDNLNPPRCININRAKGYGNSFDEEDINLIKMPPKYAPETLLTYGKDLLENNIENKFIVVAYRYRYLDGEYSALSPFTDANFIPNKFDLDYQTMENNGMVNTFNAINITVDTGSKRVTDVQIVFKESNSNTVYLIDTFNKKNEGWGDNEKVSYTFSNSKKYQALPESELYRTYDNVPLKAKALELIGSRIVFGNYVEGYDLVNKFGDNINLDYEVNYITKDVEVTNLVTTVSLDKKSFTTTVNSNSLNKGSILTVDIVATDSVNSGYYSGSLPYMLSKDYNNFTEFINDTSFRDFIEQTYTERFLEDYTLTIEDYTLDSHTGFKITSSTSNTFTVSAPVLTFKDVEDDEIISQWTFTSVIGTIVEDYTSTSIKTNRSYETAIVYLDKYGRSTPALTVPNNTVYVPQSLSTQQNKLYLKIKHLAPSWADRYKIAIKQDKGDYQTIFCNIYYDDGLYRWVKIEGANKDKVHEGDTLIVKSDLGGAVSNIIKVRVLELSEKEKNFLSGNDDEDNTTKEESGLYMKIKPVGFDMSGFSNTVTTYEGASHLRYPNRTLTSPKFPEGDLKAGSTITIKIHFEAWGSIGYKADYTKVARVNDDYTPDVGKNNAVEKWFNEEIKNLGQFGKDYTWNGVDNIWDRTPPEGYGETDAWNRNSGWGFNDNGDQFFVTAHRKGTASRSITATVSFEIRSSEGTIIFETEPKDLPDNIYYETSQTFDIVDGFHMGNLVNQEDNTSAEIELSFFNCYVQGNGVESYRYKDAFNSPYLNIDTRPTSTSIEEYKQVRRYADLTYSEPYNENNNVNGLNNFNLYKANYKEDLDKKYGSIQKIHSRDTNLLVLQEDKVHQVMFGKNLLMNADGTSNLSAVEDVLGGHVAYAGYYGISTHPESFSYDGHYAYWTDAKRGVVLRLAGDGINEISSYGMEQFFKDTLKDSIDKFIIGGIDAHYNEYSLTVGNRGTVNNYNINCNNEVYLKEATEEVKATIDYGIGEGDMVVSVNTSNQCSVKIFYNNALVIDEIINGSKVYEIPKTSISQKYLEVVVNPTTSSEVNIVPQCITKRNKSVNFIIVSKGNYLGSVVNARYKYSKGDYMSPTKQYNTLINNVGLVSFSTISGNEGDGYIPIDHSTISLTISGNNDKLFKNVGSVKYLNSDTVYTESDINTLLSIASTEPYNTIPLLDGTEEYESVLNIGDKNNVYIILEYKDTQIVNNSSFSCIKGETITKDLSVYGQGVVEIVSSTVNGQITLVGNTLTYEHYGINLTTDTFTYRFLHNGAYSNIATGTINIYENSGGGEVMIANDDYINVYRDDTTAIDVLANDTISGLIIPVIEIITPPTKGILLPSGVINMFNYTRDNDIDTSPDSFTYRLFDGDSTYSNTATVYMTVVDRPNTEYEII